MSWKTNCISCKNLRKKYYRLFKTSKDLSVHHWCDVDGDIYKHNIRSGPIEDCPDFDKDTKYDV